MTTILQGWRSWTQSIAAGVLSSALVTVGAYFLLRNSLLSIVQKSVEMLRIDDSVRMLDETRKQLAGENGQEQIGLTSVRSAIESLKSDLEGLEIAVNAQAQAVEDAISKFDSLELKDEPARLQGDQALVARPKETVRTLFVRTGSELRTIRVRTQEVRVRLPALDDAIGQTMHGASARSDEQVRFAIRQLDEIRATLLNRKDTILEVLSEWGPSR